MKNEIIFTESQRFKQWWIWLIFVGLNGLFAFGVFKQVIGGEQFGDKPMSDTGLLIASGLSIALTLLFTQFRLETTISEEAISVRFFPFHLKFRHFTWDQMNKCYVRQYAPISEYGGWGLRIGLFGKGMAYNVSGNKGLQLELTNGKKLLIGTNKPDELAEALKKLGQVKE